MSSYNINRYHVAGKDRQLFIEAAPGVDVSIYARKYREDLKDCFDSRNCILYMFNDNDDYTATTIQGFSTRSYQSGSDDYIGSLARLASFLYFNELDGSTPIRFESFTLTPFDDWL